MSARAFSGVVVCYNESRYLAACLERLSFCDDRTVIDLGSTDDSVAVAEAAGARVVRHEWVPVVEYVRGFAADQARHDWVMFMDPDQMFPTAALPTIEKLIADHPRVGVIGIPMQNYFKGRPLHHGRWGGLASAHPTVLHRRRVNFSSAVHRGIVAAEGYETHRLPAHPEHVITHYWSDSWRALLAKAQRYLREEGPARYSKGERISTWMRLRNSARMLWQSLITKRGFLDGRDGVGLCLLAAYYQWQSDASLARYQRAQARPAQTYRATDATGAG